MALTWDITECKLDKEWQKENWTAIEAMIWTTMVIDIGEITTENIDKVVFRIRCYQKVSGINYNDVLAIVPKLIGLRTNVFNTKDTDFRKKLLEVLFREVNLEMNDRH